MTYRDRGMQKWQGMILSEHTEQLEQAKRKLSYPLPFVVGRIVGVEDDRIYLRDMAGEITVLTFDDLNHISEGTIEKWYR
ncbi:hypothetical protein C9821_14875 [Listeria monocytogenes]|uniref:hypothetical protein n=1 Tax=Listeria monocytogenes TaxID=1639 RepID=UPI000D72D1B1|nr:hypothetical protein [Listeria monocytogenes]PXE16907.1 hypothetical protein C9821_14875 [Listeria monocytogenes]